MRVSNSCDDEIVSLDNIRALPDLAGSFQFHHHFRVKHCYLHRKKTVGQLWILMQVLMIVNAGILSTMWKLLHASTIQKWTVNIPKSVSKPTKVINRWSSLMIENLSSFSKLVFHDDNSPLILFSWMGIRHQHQWRQWKTQGDHSMTTSRSSLGYFKRTWISIRISFFLFASSWKQTWSIPNSTKKFGRL